MVAIAQAHKDAGAPNPVAHRDVQKVLAGIVRTKTVAQTRKDALTTDRLEQAVKALGTGLKGQRDRALLLLTFACALRRAEAAALDVADLRYDARGLVVTLRRSKTDQKARAARLRCRSSPTAGCAPRPTSAIGSKPLRLSTVRYSARSTAARS
jgi:integrase